MSKHPCGGRAAFLSSVAILVLLPDAALAQEASDPAVAPAPVPTEVPAASATAKRVYTPGDFARFAPRTAYDMLNQVPGFVIRQADVERGLGQASENVLINGQRIANKSGGAVNEARKIAASDVERVEIVEAASLGIAGLTGQVANVILKAQRKSSGQFEYKANARAHFTKPELIGGSISYTGQTGPVGYTLSARNDYGRGGFGGAIDISDSTDAITERRDETYQSEYEEADLEAKFNLDGPGTSVANLTLGYAPYWNPAIQKDTRDLVDGVDRARRTESELDGYIINLSGDYEFALGPGRLKLIGLRKFEHEPLVITQVMTFSDNRPDEGIRLSRDTRIGETIARGEYGWKLFGGDMQLSLERAFNSLDQRGALFELGSNGDFAEIDFPNGTGKVVETRYEGIATWSRALAANLDLQIAGGAERSTLERVDGDLGARNFFRPKGSVTLGWRPADDWDTSLKLRRRVGQISFYDFLDQPKLTEDRQNAGNPDLVPPQSWEVETEIGRELGAWGKTRLRTWYHRVEDIVDRIPIGDDGEGVGNLPKASRIGGESVSTLQFDPLGWTGAKLDATVGFETTKVRDPLTGEKRPISGIRNRWINLALRHDVPNTPFAWGVYGDYSQYTKNYFPTEVFRSWEGPWWVGVFVEHKNIMGLTVRADAGNLLNGRHYFQRVAYTGRRNVSPVAFYQRHDQLIGPIFTLSVRGNF